MQTNKLTPLTIAQSEGIVHEILARTQKAMGMVPNMYAGMGNNAALLDSYTYSYHSFRDRSGFTPQEQEVIFLSVAVENSCEYCVAAHSFIADKMSNVPAEITDAIRTDALINDQKLRALSVFTRVMTLTRANPSQTDVDAFLIAGYTEKDILGVITGIGVKTFSNYFNHLFTTDIDKPFAERAWKKK